MIQCDGNALFLHVHRTGGTSIKAALHQCGFPAEQQVTEDDLDRFELSPTALGCWYHHLHLPDQRKVAEGLGFDWDGLFKFCFVRNPWARAVSTYGLMRSERWAEQHPDQAEVIRRFTVSEAVKSGRLLWGCQCDWYLEDGAVGLDFVGRFEVLAEHFDQLRKILQLEVRLPHRGAGDCQREYRDQLDDEAAAIIAEAEADVIDRFGYMF